MGNSFAVCCAASDATGEAYIDRAFASFMAADEVPDVCAAFEELVEASGTCASTNAWDTSDFCALAQRVMSLKSSGHDSHAPLCRKLLSALQEREAVVRRPDVSGSGVDGIVEGTEAAPNIPCRVLVTGAGPVGLRAAVEARLLGLDVVIVEKRSNFSRVNILTLWPGTLEDLHSLGAREYLQALLGHEVTGQMEAEVQAREHAGAVADLVRVSHVLLHMGTREIQLVLLKTALLLGVRVRYGVEFAGVLAPSAEASSVNCEEDCFRAVIRPRSSPPLPTAYDTAQADAAVQATAFKPKKDGNYVRTGKCNAMELAEVDAGFINVPHASGVVGEATEVLPFNSLLVAEGEWSRATRRLGFKKSVDRFKSAIGLVVNLEYDRTDPHQVAAAPIKIVSGKGGSHFEGSKAALSQLFMEDPPIILEGLEYLKGRTHFVVACVTSATLAAHGCLVDEKASPGDIVNADNLRMQALRKLGGRIAKACIGLEVSEQEGSSAKGCLKFCTHNGVQVFDFSTRARCLESVRLLRDTGAGHHDVVEGSRANIETGARKTALVLPVGDALLEPFWPQGLGMNRGIHGALNAVWTCCVWREEVRRHRGASAALQKAVIEAHFAFQVLNWRPWMAPHFVLKPFAKWTVDWADRTLDYIVQDVVADADARKEEISKAPARRIVEVPFRVAGILKSMEGQRPQFC